LGAPGGIGIGFFPAQVMVHMRRAQRQVELGRTLVK